MEFTWQAIAERRKKEVDLFERKFIDYRNKMLEILDQLEEGKALPELQKAIKNFMQEEQGDVDFDNYKVEKTEEFQGRKTIKRFD